MSPKYSIVIPVYNRPGEVGELLESLTKQERDDFELIIVEDGSTEPCKEQVDHYREYLDIRYYFKPNSGPGLSRNYGIERSRGDYVVLFDSDCLIPPEYFKQVDHHLLTEPLDAWGGPDTAHESFTDVQKAINHAMTSSLTTGGIRGGKKQLDTYQPRSFNMGFKREIYDKVGGFSLLHPGEDPDLSYRIIQAGYRVGLIPEAYVFHKRRIDFVKFMKQVYKFGLVRNILMKWHPQSRRWVYFLPTLALFIFLLLLVSALSTSWMFLIPLIVIGLLLFGMALGTTMNISIAFLSVIASFIQIVSYGWGFLLGYWAIHIMGREERDAFPGLFFDPPSNRAASVKKKT